MTDLQNSKSLFNNVNSINLYGDKNNTIGLDIDLTNKKSEEHTCYTFFKKASHYKQCMRVKGDKCEEPKCQYSQFVITTNPEKAGFWCGRRGYKYS